MIWLSEITGKPKDHIVSISNIIEYGSFDEDWVYIGYCSNDLYSEDETYHVVAHSNTMEILIAPKQLSIFHAAAKDVEKKPPARKPGRPPKETTDVKPGA